MVKPISLFAGHVDVCDVEQAAPSNFFLQSEHTSDDEVHHVAISPGSLIVQNLMAASARSRI